MAVMLKRIYDKPSRKDGARVLVDRLWPRGLKKEAADVHAWLRDLAPSDDLRKWFHANSRQWAIFRKRYLQELAKPEATRALEELYRLAEKKSLTLLFASPDEQHNNAAVLKDLLNGARKPPTGTGPAAARGARQLQRARR
jgi:uncharacterized protein YeaO (DUF488 family)